MATPASAFDQDNILRLYAMFLANKLDKKKLMELEGGKDSAGYKEIVTLRETIDQGVDDAAKIAAFKQALSNSNSKLLRYQHAMYKNGVPPYSGDVEVYYPTNPQSNQGVIKKLAAISNFYNQKPPIPSASDVEQYIGEVFKTVDLKNIDPEQIKQLIYNQLAHSQDELSPAEITKTVPLAQVKIFSHDDAMQASLNKSFMETIKANKVATALNAPYFIISGSVCLLCGTVVAAAGATTLALGATAGATTIALGATVFAPPLLLEAMVSGSRRETPILARWSTDAAKRLRLSVSSKATLEGRQQKAAESAEDKDNLYKILQELESFISPDKAGFTAGSSHAFTHAILKPYINGTDGKINPILELKDLDTTKPADALFIQAIHANIPGMFDDKGDLNTDAASQKKLAEYLQNQAPFLSFKEQYKVNHETHGTELSKIHDDFQKALSANLQTIEKGIYDKQLKLYLPASGVAVNQDASSALSAGGKSIRAEILGSTAYLTELNRAIKLDAHAKVFNLLVADKKTDYVYELITKNEKSELAYLTCHALGITVAEVSNDKKALEKAMENNNNPFEVAQRNTQIPSLMEAMVGVNDFEDLVKNLNAFMDKIPDELIEYRKCAKDAVAHCFEGIVEDPANPDKFKESDTNTATVNAALLQKFLADYNHKLEDAGLAAAPILDGDNAEDTEEESNHKYVELHPLLVHGGAGASLRELLNWLVDQLIAGLFRGIDALHCWLVCNQALNKNLADVKGLKLKAELSKHSINKVIDENINSLLLNPSFKGELKEIKACLPEKYSNPKDEVAKIQELLKILKAIKPEDLNDDEKKIFDEVKKGVQHFSTESREVQEALGKTDIEVMRYEIRNHRKMNNDSYAMCMADTWCTNEIAKKMMGLNNEAPGSPITPAAAAAAKKAPVPVVPVPGSAPAAPRSAVVSPPRSM
jgi:hypothetical protein